MHDNDDQIIEKMKESLDFLDKSVEVKKPELMQLVKLVSEVEEKKDASKDKQFIAFILTSVLAICLEIFSFQRSITFFVIVQISAVICAAPAVILWRRKNKRQVSA